MATPPRRPPRPRRALSAPGGAVSSVGDERYRRQLSEALGVPGDVESRVLTHGFHSYPARFHPLLVRRLLADALPAGATVLDPFVGSGTTLVEAAVRGARGLGSDVNPLAVALARLKATVWPAERRALLAARAAVVTENSAFKVKRLARTRSSGAEYDDPKHYAPHVFRELVGLRETIAAESDAEIAATLALVLSAIVVKVSKQRADTAQAHVERAIGKGHATRLFGRKAEELVACMAELAAAVPRGTPAPDVRLCDARRLSHVPQKSVHVIVTSPPYLGTYDYAEQHTRRFGWLGLDAKPFADREIGARRASATATAALAAWQADVDAFIAEFARVLVPDGRAYVITGDSALGTRTIAGDQALRHAAERAGLRVIAAAAQERPSFYAPARAATRREHLLLMVR